MAVQICFEDDEGWAHLIYMANLSFPCYPCEADELDDDDADDDDQQYAVKKDDADIEG